MYKYQFVQVFLKTLTKTLVNLSTIQGSVYISYIGRSADAKARHLLDVGVRYLECPL